MAYNSGVVHIEINAAVCGGKPCIKGTRIRVQDIYVWHELQSKSPEEIVSAFPQISLGDVHAALAYYWDNRQQIQYEIEAGEQIAKETRAKYPSKLRIPTALAAQENAIPSG